MRLVRGAAAGLVLGVAWGILARTFMRLLSTEPGFSWSGTLFIIGLAALAGAVVGLVHVARTDGRTRWWRLAGIPSLALFAGPGSLLVPSVVGFALVLRGGRTARLVGVVLAAVSPTLVVGLPDEPADPAALTPLQWCGVLVLTVATGPLGWGLGELTRRWRPTTPRRPVLRESAAVPATAG